MTRREWLKLNPPPKAAGALRTLLDDLQKTQPRTAEVSGRITALQTELGSCARCPTHNVDLVRHGNRPEDMFLCPTGPHFFLWTKNGAGAALIPLDLSKPIPDIDGKIDWM